MQVDHRSLELASLKPIEVNLFKQLCAQMGNPHNSIEQLKLLKEQNDMIRDVRNTINNNRNSLTERSSGCLSQLSTHSNFDDNKSVQLTKQWVHVKPRDSLPICATRLTISSKLNNLEDVDDRLRDVLDRCDMATYNCMKELVNEYKKLVKTAADSKYYETLYEKTKKAHEQARIKLSVYQCKIAELEKLAKIQPVATPQPLEDKIKYKALLKELNDRQAKLTKQQTSILIKEMMISQDQKRYQVQQTNLTKQRKQLEEQRRGVQAIWDRVFENIGVNESFVQDIQDQYKGSLTKQRKILAEEVEELDRRHEAVDRVIQQLQGLQI